MEKDLTLQKILTLLGICMGFGLLIWLVVYFVKKDNRTVAEKFVDRAKDVIDR